MVHLLGCTVSTSTEMDPPEAFYSEVNDRHGLSTAWAPCIHSAWYSLSLFLLQSIIKCIIDLHCIILYVLIVQKLSIVI